MSMASWWWWLTLMADSQMAFIISPLDRHTHGCSKHAFEGVQGASPWCGHWLRISMWAKWLQFVCGPLNELTHQVACSCTNHAEEMVSGSTFNEVIIERVLKICQKVRECIE
jgi:hypothetical protein